MENEDAILISDLLIRCIIGINPDEREKKQDVLINISMSGDFRASAISDSIDDALNYRTIAKDVITYAESTSFNLIETLAEQIARLCLKDLRCRSVTVRVEKPGALRFARNVGITINRKRTANEFVVGISGNLSPLIYLPAAVRKLNEEPEIRLRGNSSVYITKPENDRDQPEYRNGAVIIETALNRADLKDLLKSVEKACGRVGNKDAYASRTVDLDVLVENGVVIDKDVNNRWYLQALIAELKGIVPESKNDMPHDPKIDRILMSVVRNIISQGKPLQSCLVGSSSPVYTGIS